MKKRLFCNILAAVLLILALAPAAYATEVSNATSGTCGEGISWVLEGYTMTISGSGDMDDGCPWEAYKDHIEHVIFTGGVSKVGAGAFEDCQFIRTVDFGDAMREIGERAFYGCERIQLIHLPATFRTFGAEAFRECTNLKYVYCDGYMPRFNSSCLWTGNYVSVFYPTNNPWSFEYTQPLVSSYGGNLGIMMGNYADSDVVLTDPDEEDEDEDTAEETKAAAETEAATEATEAATEPMIVLVTEPATEPTTQPTTEPTVPETTEETTVPTTEAVETTEAPETTEETEPETPVKKIGGNGWIGLMMIAGVLTFLIAGAMIFRSASRRGGRY